MNREQRRQYDRKIKNDRTADMCPECKHKTHFFTSARGEKDTVLKCERCGEVIREGEELTRLMPPGLYLPMPLEALDGALLAEAERIIKEETADVKTGQTGYVECQGEIS